jgi:hypothetical protein
MRADERAVRSAQGALRRHVVNTRADGLMADSNPLFSSDDAGAYACVRCLT